jgi:predicted  nucleic acid-binding Zn-ribbon protein
MDDQPVTVGTLSRFQQQLFLQLEGIESRLTARIDTVNARVDDVYGHVDGLYHRLDRLEAEYQMVVLGLRRVEERLGRLEGRVEAVELRLDRIEGWVVSVEKRLDGLDEKPDDIGRAQEKFALRSELQQLKARVEALQDEIRVLEARLED